MAEEKRDWTGNSRSIFAPLGASNHTSKERQEHDFYATSPVAIDKLMNGLPLDILKELNAGKIWENACGRGDLSERLLYFGFDVISTDLVYRGYGKGNVDFLQCTGLPEKDVNCILTNPPYSRALPFVLHSLEFLPDDGYCIMFLKTTFLEGKKRYKELFHSTPPMLVLQFVERILCAKNAEFERMKRGGGSAVSYAFYVWKKGYKGDTIIKWI